MSGNAMLAHQFAKQKHRIEWPAFAQPKLDGFRCLAHITEVGVEFRTRNDKPLHTLAHLSGPLQENFSPGTIVDGELYADDLTLQDIASGAKRMSSLSERLELWVYDLLNDDPYHERLAAVNGTLGDQCPAGIVCVPTIAVENTDAMRAAHAENIAAGFEGTILRNAEGYYHRGKRSSDLQKVKDFQDGEFRIIGYEEATGKAAAKRVT